MEITILGTSSAVHTYNRNHPAIAIKAFAETMLFDCGECTQRQLIYGKVSPMKISKIFLSHYHGDHIFGLPGLLQSMNFRNREKPLDIYGPPGLLKLKKGLNSLGFGALKFDINLHEITNGIVVDCDDFVVKSCEVRHNVPSLAYSIEEKKKPRFLREKAIELGVPVGPDFGKLHNGEEVEVNGKIIKPEQVLGPPRKGIKIVYSGDTSICEEMIMFAKESTLLIHEATYMNQDHDKALENGHSTTTEAAIVARESNSKKLLLTHISARYNDSEPLLKEARQMFKNTEIAHDLMKITIK